MFRKKRMTALALTGAMLCTALAGCGGTDGGSTADGGKAADGAKTKLRVQVIGTWTQEDTLDAVTGAPVSGMHVIEEDFESKHPDIDLEFVIIGWDDYQKKTQTMIMGDQADVFQVPGIALMADQDVLEPLAPYIERDNFDLGVYLDGQVDGWRVQGPNDSEPQIYALPWLADTRVIMYDKQIFDDWGVPYLSEYPTYEEIKDAASKMTGINPKTGKQTYGVVWSGADAADTVMNLNESLGGTWGEGARFSELTYNFNSETMVQAANMLKELLPYAPAGVLQDKGTESFGTEANDVAIDLRCGPVNEMCVARDNGLNDRFGAAYLPINESLGMGGLFVGSPVAIGKNCKDKDAAWEYLKYTATDFYQEFLIPWRQMPCTKNALKFEAIAQDANMTLALDSMQRLWTPRYIYRAAAPRGYLTAAVESILSGSKDAQTALNEAQKQAEDWTSQQ